MAEVEVKKLGLSLGYWNVRYLLARGWTRKAIRERLGAPDRVSGLHKRYGRPSYLYEAARVVAIEESGGHRFRNTVDGHDRFARRGIRNENYFSTEIMTLPDFSSAPEA